MAALDGFYRAQTLLASVVFGVLSLLMMFTASLRADLPTRSSFWMRMIATLLLLIDILAGLVTGAWAGVEFWLFVLIAEYAATIRTIPPLTEKRTRGVTAAEGS
jgi:hypothetical protein